MKTITGLLVVLVISHNAVWCEAPRKTLVLLSVVPKTGDAPRNALMCMLAMQVAVDAANDKNASRLLPNYKVELQFADEGLQTSQAPVQFLTFLEQARQYETERFISPVVIGSMFLCNVWSSLVRHFNMAQISEGCGGSLFTANRQRFPNLYRIIAPGDASDFATAIFIQKFGDWRQIAVLSNSANVNNDQQAKHFYAISLLVGLEIVWLAGVQDIDSATLISLRKSDARIVNVFMVEVPMVLKFMCLTYQNDMKAPKFVFFLQSRAFVDPETVNLALLPTGCSKAILAEQLRISFFAGLANTGPRNVLIPELGYDLDGFERRFNLASDFTRLPDYNQRLQCHDAAEAALIVLDKTDRLLRSSWNLSLESFHYGTDEDQRKIMAVVNNSAKGLNFVSTRIGQLSYSDRAEVDRDPLGIYQYQNRTYKQVLRISYTGLSGDGMFDFNLYNVTVVNVPQWTTRMNQPPKDLSGIRIDVKALHRFLQPTVTVLGCLSAVFDLYIVGLILRRDNSEGENSRSSISVDALFLLASLAMNAAAITFSIDAHLTVTGTLLCRLQLITTVIGLSIIHSSLLLQFSAVVFETKQELYRRFRGSSPFQSSSSCHRRRKPSRLTLTCLYSSRRQVFLYNALVIVFVIINVLVLAVWMGASLATEAPQLVSSLSSVQYDEMEDAYFQVRTDTCHSETAVSWIGPLLALHFVVLLLATFMAIKTRHVTFSEAHLRRYVTLLRYFTWNATTFFVVAAFLTFVIPQKHTTIRSSFLSFACILYSLAASGVLFWTNFLKLPQSNRSSSVTSGCQLK